MVPRKSAKDDGLSLETYNY